MKQGALLLDEGVPRTFYTVTKDKDQDGRRVQALAQRLLRHISY